MTAFTIQPHDAIVATATPLGDLPCSRCAGGLGAVAICAKWPAEGTTEFRYCAKCGGATREKA